VPLERIIEFKRKRYDELQHFRHAMDKLYLKVVDSNDPRVAIGYAVDEVILSLRDLNRVMNETLVSRVLSMIKVALSVTDIAVGAALGKFAGATIGLPLIRAAVGVVAPALKVSFDSSLFRRKQIPAQFCDYAYLYHAEHEFGASP
jgi:hypothetical protein